MATVGVNEELTALIALLQVEFDRRSLLKRRTKTYIHVVNCKNTLTLMHGFVVENNRKAVYLTASQHPSLVLDLNKCFKTLDQNTQAVRIYSRAIEALLKWYREEAE